MKSKSNSTMTFSQQTSSFVKRNPAWMAVIIGVLLYVVTVIVVPTALSVQALSTLTMMTLLLSFTAIGQTIVLIGGGVDLSVGSVMSASAIFAAAIMNGQDGRFIPAFLFAIVMGATVGLVNGICTTKIHLPPLIVTLVVSNLVAQLQFVFLGGRQFGFAGPRFIQTVIGRLIGDIPNIVFYALILFPLAFFILKGSRFGKQLYLMGNNIQAARLSGINVNKIRILSYVLSGIFAGFAGLLGVGMMQTAQAQMFEEYAFNSLIAVIIGGTTFAGGVGGYGGSIAGAMLMVMLSNMLSAFQLSQPVRNLVLGGVLMLLLVMYNRKKPVRE